MGSGSRGARGMVVGWMVMVAMENGEDVNERKSRFREESLLEGTNRWRNECRKQHGEEDLQPMGK